VAGLIDFAHRTFQEFFAAHVVVYSRDMKQLIGHAHEDLWREVIILVAGLASQTFCEQLVNGLIKRGDEEKSHRYQLHLLAVSCLETTIELGPEVRADVEKRLGQLVPPRTMTDAKSLAVAGELAVRYLDKKRLMKKGKLSSTTCAACVRTLATVGSDAALDMLEGYANDTREPIINELLKAWDKFDREEYARRILAKTFRNKTNLRLERAISLDGIQYFTSLTNLDLSGSQVRDVSALGSLTNLTSLNLSNTEVSDVSALGSLTNLTSLDLANTPTRDVSALGSLMNLTSLSLSVTGVSDVSALGNLTNLTSLSLFKTYVRDVSALGSLTNLTSLDLTGTQVRDVSALGSLTNLTSLNLIDTQISDVSALGGLTNLTSLNLTNTEVSNVSALTNLTNLKLYFAYIQVNNVETLQNLPNVIIDSIF